MGTRDDRVDAYIARSAEFARPILEHLRAIVHVACPEMEETMKWSSPHFQYKGMLVQHGGVQGALFVRLLESSLILDKKGEPVEKAAGQFGRITALADLPSKKILTGYIKQAMKLNDDGDQAAGAAEARPPSK